MSVFTFLPSMCAFSPPGQFLALKGLRGVGDTHPFHFSDSPAISSVIDTDTKKGICNVLHWFCSILMEKNAEDGDQQDRIVVWAMQTSGFGFRGCWRQVFKGFPKVPDFFSVFSSQMLSKL